MYAFIHSLGQTFANGFGFGVSLCGITLQVLAFLAGLALCLGLATLVVQGVVAGWKSLERWAWFDINRRIERQLRRRPTFDFVVAIYQDSHEAVVQALAASFYNEEEPAEKKLWIEDLRASQVHIKAGQFHEALARCDLLNASVKQWRSNRALSSRPRLALTAA